MQAPLTHDHCAERLRTAGLRPTAQRIGLCRLLLAGPHRHVSAQEMVGEAVSAGLSVSQATVYNVLHDLVQAGILREVDIGGSTVFDTNVAPHCHVVEIDSGAIRDIPVPTDLAGLLQDGEELVDLVIRVRSVPNL